MNDNEDRAYQDGNRAAWREMLALCLHSLGYEATTEARVVAEREAALVVLRDLCEQHGDNEWDNELHLADIIEKHLGKYLGED